MEILKHGVFFDSGLEIVSLCGDDKYGHWYLLKGKRDEVELRVTKSGLLRVGEIRRAGPITARAADE